MDDGPSTQPLVSIVTPCLDPPARMLRRCLTSVAAQTYSPVEHIVIDGGSDPTVVAELERAGVAFVSERDGGQADAINKGFALARGDIVGWLNADDVLAADAVARVVAAFRRRPAAAWAYGDCEIVGGRSSGVLRAHRRLSERLIAAGETVPQPGSLMWRRALDAVGPLDESFAFAMDADLVIRLFDRGQQSVRVPGVLARFEVHADSKTGSDTRSRFLGEHARALEKSGRRTAAAVTYGRAAVAGGASQRSVGTTEYGSVAGQVRDLRPNRDLARAFEAGVACERAITEIRTRPLLAVRQLGTPSIWRFSESRTVVLLAAVRALRVRRPRI
jgi:GT2 family glycosyltransferase